jgi:tetratricopeptide (TPR) repeat protein
MRIAFAVLLSISLSSPALAVQPTDPHIREYLESGKSAFNQSKYPEAVKAFKEAVKLSKDTCDYCLIWLARAYEKQGRFKDALQTCDKAISCAPTDVDRAAAHNTRGYVLLKEGAPEKTNEAQAEFRKAIDLDPHDPDFHFNLAAALLRQKNDDAGLKELDTYLASAPPSGSTVETARAWKANPRRARETFAPEFSLTTLQGDTIKLSQLSGKIVVLDFWATWCPPCRASVPELKEMIKKYPRERLTVISISGDK